MKVEWDRDKKVRYFIKNPTKGDVGGSFSTEQLKVMISQSVINTDFLATSDLGETLETIKKQKASDWFSLNKISDLSGTNLIPESEISPDQIRFKLTASMVGALCLGIPHFLFVAVMLHSKSADGIFFVILVDYPIAFLNWDLESRVAWFVVCGGLGSIMYAFVGALLFHIFSLIISWLSERAEWAQLDHEND